MKWAFFLILIGSIVSCKSVNKQSTEVLKTAPREIRILDSAEAAIAIIDDDMEGFFDKVTVTEMSIQMKKNFASDTPRNQVVEAYQDFLQSDVESFTEEERTFVKNTFSKVLVICNQINKDIFPDQIELIKTKGRHYGPSVYYTRENRIIIPENELENRNADGFLQVMFHELFHIYSRLNPQDKAELYQLIGFYKVDATMASLQMSDSLRRRILLNPDGIDFTYAIQLKDPAGYLFEALPIIAATSFDFKPSQPAFFSYLSFNLYRIEQLADGGYRVITQPDGTSTLSLNSQPDFFAQIKDNTEYIIHPDEIMADNFTLLALSKTDDPKHSLKQLSEEGQQLIAEVESILKK